MNAHERATIHFKGRVQGVGFRYSCRQLAKGFDITGEVRNLEDGRVKLILEGEKEEILEFLKAISESHLKSFIQHQALEWSPQLQGFQGFQIIA